MYLDLFWKTSRFKNGSHFETILSVQGVLVYGQFGYVRVNSNREHPPPGKPRAFVSRWVLGAGHLTVNSVPALRAFANNNKLVSLLTSYRHFRRCSASRVSKSQALSFWSRWWAFIDHKRPIKAIEPFALSFCSRSDSFRDLFYAVLLSRSSYVY